MGNPLKWIHMVLRLCCSYNLMHFILERLFVIMGHLVELNLLKMSKGFMVLDFVDDRLYNAIIMCHGFVNYWSGDIKRTLV